MRLLPHLSPEEQAPSRSPLEEGILRQAPVSARRRRCFESLRMRESLRTRRRIMARENPGTRRRIGTRESLGMRRHRRGGLVRVSQQTPSNPDARCDFSLALILSRWEGGF